VVGCFALHGEGTVFLGLGRGVLVGVAFVLLRWERRTKTGLDWIGSDQEWKKAFNGL
jgi:hypothetical protein